MRPVVAALLVLLAGAQPAPAATPPDFEDVALVTGLMQPTAVAWAPDGRIFIAQKDGRLRVASPAGALRPAPVVDLSGHVNAFADRGMLGLALDRDFADNGHVYLLYTVDADRSAPDGPKTARLSRITVRPDDTVEDPQDPETVLLGDLPSPDITHTIGPSGCWPARPTRRTASSPAARFSWDVTLHHATHTHPFSTLWGAGEVLFTTDSHDADSYYEIRATATDQGGVSASSTVSVRPEAIELRIISEPPGQRLVMTAPS